MQRKGGDEMIFEKRHDVGKWTNDGPSRFQIEYIHINGDDNFVEATDGKCLIRVPFEGAIDEKLVTPMSLSAAIKLKHYNAMIDIDGSGKDGKIKFPKCDDAIFDDGKFWPNGLYLFVRFRCRMT